MGLFDFFNKKTPHSKKIALAYKEFGRDLTREFFPGGKNQASLVVRSLARILNLDLSSLDVKGYKILLAIYSTAFVMEFHSHMPDESVVASLMVSYEDYIRNENMARRTLAYCLVNAKDNSFSLSTAEDVLFLNMMDGILSGNIETANINREVQNDNLDDESYGLVPQKPVYASGIVGSSIYIESLQTSEGKKITWERRGSMMVQNINGAVDIYDAYLNDGSMYQTIYVNMYGTSISKIAPRGFKFKQ